MNLSYASHERFALASRRVVCPDGVKAAAVLIENGTVKDVVELPLDIDDADDIHAFQAHAKTGNLSPEDPLEFMHDQVIAPGLVDSHVHINEPGHTDWEGFETATKAAAAGGVTTLLDMPLNSIPVTTTSEALWRKREAATGKCWVDVGFYGGIVPGNLESIGDLLRDGVFGIKAFLCHSGLDEFPNASLDDLRRAAPVLQRFSRPLLVHAELTNSPAPRPASTRHYAEYMASRPPKWELEAIDEMISFCRETRCRVHIVHLANADALPALQEAKAEGLPITVETCPHYLHFLPADVPDGATQFKCAPPFRDVSHQSRLWDAIRAGAIDSIGSDHSPCPPDMKRLEDGDFMAAWGGIASLELTLPVTYTGTVSRSIDLQELFARVSTSPAKIFGLGSRKGSIAAGNDADLVIWSPESNWTVDASRLFHRHKVTPYDGHTFFGQVSRTYLRGELVFSDGQPSDDPIGQLLAA